MKNTEWSVDVAVVGGGTAGLTAAVALSRFRRSVVVIDAGHPRNAPAASMHNYLSRDGVDPSELLAIGRDELARFGGTVLADTAVGAERRDGSFVLRLRSGATVTARRLIVASGTVDVLPDVSGLAERWGRDVVHCPYCHGWEVRDQQLAVLATNPDAAVHQALLFRELSDDVRVLEHTAGPFTDDQRAQLDALAIPIVEGEVAAVLVDDDRIRGVQMRDGRVESAAALVVASALETRSAVLDDLGVPLDPGGRGGYAHAPWAATSVPGVWVAGNVADPMATVVIASAAGMSAAGEVNADLIAERVAAAIAAVSPAHSGATV